MTTDAPTLEDRIQRVRELDLEPIVFKLTTPEHGETGLSLKEADRLVLLYRQWLILCLRHPNAGIVPTREIDEVWHTHILDTDKYARDSDHVFGFFLHHFPYLGLRGEEDARRLRDQFAITGRLFEEVFGTPLPSAVISCAAGKHSFPGACTEGADCETFAEGFENAERPRPLRS